MLNHLLKGFWRQSWIFEYLVYPDDNPWVKEHTISFYNEKLFLKKTFSIDSTESSNTFQPVMLKMSYTSYFSQH